MALTTNPQQTAQRIQRLARATGLYLHQLAPLFGVSRFTMKDWSCGRRCPQLRHQRTLEQLERRNIVRIMELEALDAGDLTGYYHSLKEHSKQGAPPL